MKQSALAVLALALAPALAAQPLKIVHVNAPAVNYVFSTTGTVTVNDMTAPIWTNGFLQSRIYDGQPGAPAAGLHVYEYRIDLRNVVGITAIPYITSLTIDFGPVVGSLDFDGDKKPDQVFVVTSGGLGNVAPTSAFKSGSKIKFAFNPPVAGGSAPGKGDSSYFFGIVSKYKPHKITATATHNLGGPVLSLQATAPAHP